MPLQRKESLPKVAASKIPVPKRGHLHAKENTSSPTAKSKLSKLNKVPQTTEEKMDFLRSKLENSMSAFIKTRKELEEVLSAGGSSEQGRPLPDAAELKSELQRHRSLTSRVKSISKENRAPKKPCQDTLVPTNSYDFLKSIVG